MFLSVALVTKKLWAILDFFSQTRLFFRPVPYPINKKKITRNPLNYDLLKVTQFHGDSVKNKSARTKQLHPDFLGLKYIWCYYKANTFTKSLNQF